MGRINTGGVTKKVGDFANVGASVSGTTLKLTVPKGYYDGSSGKVTITDPDFIESKIVAPNELFGKTGTAVELKVEAGNNVWQSKNVSLTATTESYAQYGQSTIQRSGTIRVSWFQTSNNTRQVNSKLLKNGAQQGSIYSTTTSASFTADLSVAPNDVISVQHAVNIDGFGTISTIQNMSIGLSIIPPFGELT